MLSIKIGFGQKETHLEIIKSFKQESYNRTWNLNLKTSCTALNMIIDYPTFSFPCFILCIIDNFWLQYNVTCMATSRSSLTDNLNRKIIRTSMTETLFWSHLHRFTLTEFHIGLKCPTITEIDLSFNTRDHKTLMLQLHAANHELWTCTVRTLHFKGQIISHSSQSYQHLHNFLIWTKPKSGIQKQ